MQTAASALSQAIEGFRREHALSFMQQLAGQAPTTPSRAQRWLVSERAEESLSVALQRGECGAGEHACTVAHMARAQLELALGEARAQAASWSATPISVEGETRTVRALAREWLASETAPKRMRLAREVASSLPTPLHDWAAARARADAQATSLLRKLAAPRHADAGPEGGTAALAESFLNDTRDLAREALQHAEARAGLASSDGTEACWALTGPRFSTLFPSEGRLRRVGHDWDALGLRRTLAGHARAAKPHAGLFPHGHVIQVSSPHDVRVSLPAFDHGLLSELCAAEAVGRAVGLVHASPSLPAAVRHAPVASVARALGSLGVLMFAEPLFLARQRGLSRRECYDVARLSAALWLIDARLCAAALLARGLHGEGWEVKAADLAAAALTRPLPQALGAWLVTRVSPGPALRARVHALAIVRALRERFDEDWFRNPRTGEPLRGAAARAGELSVEAFAVELGADVARGPLLLSALF